MAEHSLVLPFLDESSSFAHGVEVGMLYQRMRFGGERVIEELFLIDNEEQILLMAGWLGWHVVWSKPIETPGWVRIRMRRER